MTIDELYQRIDNKLGAMDSKLDALAVKVERHDAFLSANGHEMQDVKVRVTRLEEKQSKHGNLLWWLLGGGAASGAGLMKLIGAN